MQKESLHSKLKCFEFFENLVRSYSIILLILTVCSKEWKMKSNFKVSSSF